MSLTSVPYRTDFFPKTRRGHGSAHSKLFKAPDKSVGSNPAYREMPCVDPTCNLNAPKSKNQHSDQGANIREWCEERGISLKRQTETEAMLHATGQYGDNYRAGRVAKRLTRSRRGCAVRTIQLEDHTGLFRVEIPEQSKVTFGPAIPFSPSGKRMHGLAQPANVERDVYAVSVYNGPTDKAGLLAVFPGVIAYRELETIKILRPLRGEDGKEVWTADEDAWKQSRAMANRLSEVTGGANDSGAYNSGAAAAKARR